MDFGAPTYLPMDRRGDDATRPTVAVPADTEPPVVVAVGVVVAAEFNAVFDTDVVGRTYPPVVRNEPARDAAVAAAADSYVPVPPIVRTVGAANAADVATTHNIDTNDVFIPSFISPIPMWCIILHFCLYTKSFFQFFCVLLKFISQTQ
jgi:hypothetical protein